MYCGGIWQLVPFKLVYTSHDKHPHTNTATLTQIYSHTNITNTRAHWFCIQSCTYINKHIKWESGMWNVLIQICYHIRIVSYYDLNYLFRYGTEETCIYKINVWVVLHIWYLAILPVYNMFLAFEQKHPFMRSIWVECMASHCKY